MKQLVVTVINVALTAAIIIMIFVCAPKPPEDNTATPDIANITHSDDSRFERISYDWTTGNDIVYDKYTKVMYTQSPHNGMLTVIIDENGKPMLYKGE